MRVTFATLTTIAVMVIAPARSFAKGDTVRITIVEAPKGVPVYEVSFVTTRSNPGTYVVRYAIDPATKRGYVYLPGKTDAGYRDNVFLIYREVEGNWFHAWDEWEKLANPLIERARTKH
jgi:hypothetical protein